MKININNKGRIILNSKNLASCFILCAVIILCRVLYPEIASSGPYIDSAHGNSSYGVNRSSLSSYSRGNCAHCHEQHASVEGVEPAPDSPAGPDYYLLFKDLWVAPPQNNQFCFGCHTLEPGTCELGTATCQSDWQRTNYCYSNWRGGDTALICPDSIYESFQFVTNTGASQLNCGSNVGSSHMLRNIRNFMAGKVGFPSDTSYVNPCDACHNPHRAKRDYPCSRTGGTKGHADLTTWEVWGDDASEKMNALTANYWAPLRFAGGYEPDGCATVDCQNGSNTPDYASLCTDCHNNTNVIYSNRLGRNLYKITWTATGDFHGNKPRDDTRPGGEWGDLLVPYKVGVIYQKTNYLLSCTDCHEPHGSPNEFLLRKTLNGGL